MINVSSAWNRAIFNDKRDYLEYVDITLANGTVLNLTNANIWEGGFSIEDAVSSDSDLQLGTAIINKFTLCINNMYDDFSGYVFEDARLSVRVGLVTDTSTEVIQKGRYIVENASYNGDLITLECYDYMRFFDVPYSNSNQVYPATLDNIVRNACTDIGITLNTPNFPHKTFVVQNRPEDEATTYREVIAWAAQVAGCYARMNPNGQLELKWYDQAALSQALEDGLDGGIFDASTPYSTGDRADGGSFNPWNTGYVYDSGVFSNASNVHMISSLYSEDISVDDVVITGVRILVKTQNDEQNGEVIKTFQQGSNGYVIEISENPMITVSDANTVLQWLATQLIGFKFRKANISHGSNPAIEAGDVAIIFDRKGGIYPIIVSKTSFSVGSSQTTVSAAQTPSRNSAARFSAETKNYVELRKRLKNERTTREQIEAQLAQQIEESNGLYETDEVQADQSVKHYLHNKPNLEDSDIQILVSSVGITVTANGTDPNPTWYGLTVNGDLIARILTATGVNADWINAGQLVIEDANGNETFFADTQTGIVRINAQTFSLSGQSIGNIVDTKLVPVNNKLTQEGIYMLLTANETIPGIFMQNGQLYINASYIQSGTLKLGGADNASGTLQVKNANGYTVVDINNTRSQFDGYNSSNVRTGRTILRDGSVYTYKYDSSSSSLKQVLLINHYSLPDVGTITMGSDATQMEIGSHFSNLGKLRLNNDWWVTSGSTSRPINYAQNDGIKSANVIGGGLLFENGGIVQYTSTDENFLYKTTTRYLKCLNQFTAVGTKSRLVKTDDYANRLLYCYETPTPMFGDVGEGIIGEDGKCYVTIDPIFAETVSLNQYQVFLQKYGAGDCYVSERKSSYFVVEGTPNMAFGWEIKAKQSDFDQLRLDRDEEAVSTENAIDYVAQATEHINELMKERGLAE